MARTRGVSITGMGVQCAVAHGVPEFDRALREGRSGISFATPEPGLPTNAGFRGRLSQRPDAVLAAWAASSGILNDERALHRRIGGLLRRAGRPTAYSLLAAVEAAQQAGLGAVGDRRRLGLVVAGSNLAPQMSYEATAKFHMDPAYVSPRYAYQFFDSDLLGVVSEALRLHGDGLTAGGASASGNVGLLQGLELIRSGRVDACLVVAGMQELSAVELAAFTNLGALGGRNTATAEPSHCSRPFDTRHDGFIFGEGAAAMLLESTETALSRGAEPLADLAGGATAMDGSHLTQPSAEGEEFVMRQALDRSGVPATALDLVSAHATATPLGDRVEAAAIQAVLGPQAGRVWVNATKAMLGHCLGSAALIEAIACVLQIRGRYVHPSVNLREPITCGLRLAPAHPTITVIRNALNNSFGFGGINTAVVIRSADTEDLGGE